MTVVYKITRAQPDGEDQFLGHLIFDAEGAVTLKLDGTAPEHIALRDTWEKVSQIDPLPVVRRVREPLDGGGFVTQQVAMDIPKTDKNYPLALVIYLGEYHGYFMAKDFDAMAEQN